MAGKSLYVGNLSYSTSESKLRELFAEYEPSEVRLIGDKGFAFVDIPAEKANDAIAAPTCLAGPDLSNLGLSADQTRALESWRT